MFHKRLKSTTLPPELTTQLQTSENIVISPKRMEVPSRLSNYITILLSFVSYTRLLKTIQYSAVFAA